MTLRQQMQSDADTFLNVEEFGEVITYHFAGGGSREIKAVVDRNPVAFYQGEVFVSPSFSMEIANRCEDGVLITEIDTGGDEVELPEKDGGTRKQRVAVLMVGEHDHAMIEIFMR